MKKIDLNKFIKNNIAWVILIVVCIVFCCFTESFFSFRNIISILNQNAYIVVASLGITPIMMSGSMDLSVGYQMSIIGIICAKLMVEQNSPIALVMVFGIIIGIAMGVLNCVLAQKLKLSLLVITLGTMTIFQGASYIISGARTVNGFSGSFKYLGQGNVGEIPFAIILMAILFAIMSFILNKTYFGRYIYALGGNEEATRLAGINVKKMKYIIAIIAGAFIGLASLMLISRMGTSQSNIGPGTEFTVITGIFLGGVSIRGGEGKLSGVLAGILILGVLTNGMQLASIDPYWQYVFKGVLMLAAIGFDVFQLNRREKVKVVSE